MINSLLTAGINQVSDNQQITFTKYFRVILPLDGMVCWIKSGSINTNALEYPAMFGGEENATGIPEQITVPGMLHYDANQANKADETITVSNVSFSTSEKVDVFNLLAPDYLWIASVDGYEFAFSSKANYTEAAGLHHYQGQAMYPVVRGLLIDNPAALNVFEPVLSNSTPIWLGLNKYFPIYPSYLVPENTQGVYGVVSPTDTEMLWSAAWTDRDGNTWQNMSEKVRITLYNVKNNQAWDFLKYVLENSIDTNDYGIMETPVIIDAKRPQSEINAVAIKKYIDFKISYYQSRQRGQIPRIIETVFTNFVIGG